MDPATFHEDLETQTTPQAIESSLFKNSPPAVQALFAKSKKLKREAQRKQWYANNFGNPMASDVQS